MPRNGGGASTPSLAEYVQVVLPHLNDALLSSSARERLRGAAHEAPLSDLAGFECLLGDASTRADLIVRLPRLPLDVAAARARDPVWRRIRALTARLREGSAPHFDSVNVMGLEFDVPPDARPLAPPALFFELNAQADLGAPRLIALAQELLDADLTPACRALVGRCVTALPASSAPFQVGAMLSRPGEALRLVMGDVPLDAALDYLRTVGWTGEDGRARELLQALADRVGSIAISMDVAHVVHPRIGIECYVQTGADFVRRFERLLERLEELRLCTRGKREALVAWSGICSEATCAAPWPSRLRWGDRLLAARASSVIARTLGHVKLVLQPAAPVEAKAYLGFAHYWLDHRDPSASWQGGG